MSERESRGMPLEKVNALDGASVRKLKGFWITTAEQLVAQAATPEGKTRLAGLLGIAETAFADLIAKVKSSLDPETVRRLEAEHPTDKGMGALKPPS